jgi:hypothetical protein
MVAPEAGVLGVTEQRNQGFGLHIGDVLPIESVDATAGMNAEKQIGSAAGEAIMDKHLRCRRREHLKLTLRNGQQSQGIFAAKSIISRKAK